MNKTSKQKIKYQKKYQKLNKDKYLQYQSEYRKNNREKLKKYFRDRWNNKKEELKPKLKKYRELNKNKIKEQKHKEYLKHKDKYLKRARQRMIEKSEEIRLYRHKYYQKNKDKIIKKTKKYAKEHYLHLREKARKLQYQRWHNDISFRLRMIISHRINMALKHNTKSKKTMQLIGCSVYFLKQHLESKFKPGMSWKNYGKWHIDHILPCSSFDLSKPSEQKKCFNYKNLQPLWARDNIIKSDKIINNN